MAYDTARLVISCSAKIFKIQVEVYANEDNFVSNIQTYDTVMISIVFCSLIIHEYYNCPYKTAAHVVNITYNTIQYFV